MSFSIAWVNCTMNFATSVTYSVVVNGMVSEKFFSTPRLRQGDLLSPYLFLIYGEGLSTLLCLATLNGQIQGERVVRGAPQITYLLFVNDSLIFREATIMRAFNLMQVL